MAEHDDLQTLTGSSGEFEPIVEEYAGLWKRVLQAVEFPDVESFVASVPEPARPQLRAVLSDMDTHFRRQLTEIGDEGTISNWSDETVIGSPPGDDASESSTPVSDAEVPESNAVDVAAEEPTVIGAESSAPSRGDQAIDIEVDSRISEEATVIPTGSFSDVAEEGADPAATPTFTGDAAAASAVPDAEGRRVPAVPGYEIDGVLGRGGMGIVYRARQSGLNRTVALKMILNADHAASDHIQRFQLEAEAVAQLQHPNIVQVFETGRVDGLPYFSLEFVDGKSLEEYRDGKPMATRRAATLIGTIARAMHSAHQRGIVHRDLKPANVLMTADGIPKITDFGLVKRVEADSSQTRTGTIMGTPSYMAPEQAWGQTDVGPAADVYALGATLYALLTGRPPFQGPTPLETIMQLRNEEPVAPSRLQPGVPRDLETICLKALQKEPQSRYATAEALADDLQRFLHHEPILARPVSRVERFWRWCRRNPALATAAGVSSLLGLCLMVGGPIAAWMINEQKQIAVAKEAEARQNAERANENAKEAKDNLATAQTQREVAERTLFFVAEDVYDSLNDRPGMKPVQRKLLLKTLSGLEQVADLDDGPTGVDVIEAKSHRKMGDVLLGTGLAEQAFRQYAHAHEIVLAMVEAGNPEKPHVPKLNLGRSYINLGKAAQGMGDAPRALEYFTKSLDVRTSALDVAPDPLFVKQEMADARGHLGNLCLALGQPDTAVEHFQNAYDLRAAWYEQAPGNPAAMRESAGARMALARAHAEQGQLDAALEEYEAARELLEKVAAAEPQSLSGQGNLAHVRMQQAVVHLYAGRPREARDEYAQATTILEKLLESDPDNAVLQRKLGLSWYGLGVAAAEEGDRTAAQEAFHKCLELRRTLAEKAGNDVTLHVDLMLAHARLGHTDEVERIGAEVSEQIADDATQLYVVAGAYGIASTSESESGRAARLRERGLQTLQEAVVLGYRGTFLLDHDPDLDALRDLDEYAEIRAAAAQKLAQAREQSLTVDGE